MMQMRKLFENEERIGHNVWVEGIIGCGKTTLVNKIKDELGKPNETTSTE